MASISVLVKKYRNKRGENPVYIRVNHKGKEKHIKLFSVSPEDWDSDKIRVKSSHKNHKDYNHDLNSKLRIYEERVYELKRGKKSFTLIDILDTASTGLLSAYIDRYVLERKHEIKLESIRKYDNLKAHILNFRDVIISDIDKKYITSFQVYLRAHDRINSEGTVSRYIKFILAVLRHNDIFIKFKVKVPPVIKCKLTKEEVENILNLKNLSCKEQFARWVFMLCLFTRGSRVGDILMLEPPSGDRIEFYERKNRMNTPKKFKSVAINEPLTQILDECINYMPFANLESQISPLTAKSNQGLKLISARIGCNKRITNHTARHTYSAWHMRDIKDVKLLSEALNHSSIRVTEEYIRDLMSDEEKDKSDATIFDKFSHKS